MFPNAEYIISLLIPVIASAGLYALWRTVLWAIDAATYRWTSTLQLSTDNWNQWQWLESFIRVTLLKKANHWVADGDQTKPAPGNVIIPAQFVFEGKTIRLRIAAEEPSRMIIHQRQEKERRVATLWTRHVDGAYWDRFLQFLRSEHQRTEANHLNVELPFIARDGWQNRNRRSVPKRSLNTLTLPDGLMGEILCDLEAFLSPAYKNFCLRKGLTYRRGWLLEGPPGNGKSSFILAVASFIGAEVTIVSLNSTGLDDVGLRTLMVGHSLTERPCLLVLEDIDCLFTDRAAADAARVTFSGLLNALDGVGAPENAIVIMTTNHPEKLDPALIRPGRVDRHFQFPNPDDTRIAAHYVKFFPKETRLSEATISFVEHCRRSSTAEGRMCSMAHVHEQVLREVNKLKAWDSE
jgi:hypothetical protein